MAVVNDSSLARPSSTAEGAFQRVFMAIVLAVIAIGAIVGMVIAVSTGQGEAVFGIGLIAGGLLFAAALS